MVCVDLLLRDFPQLFSFCQRQQPTGHVSSPSFSFHLLHGWPFFLLLHSIQIAIILTVWGRNVLHVDFLRAVFTFCCSGNKYKKPHLVYISSCSRF